MKTRAGERVAVLAMIVCAVSVVQPALAVGNTCADNDDCSFLNTLCAVGFCDTDTFMCDTLPINNGQGCDDSNNCTTNDVCGGGVCAGTAVDCTVLNTDCKTFACNPAGSEGNCATETNINEAMPCAGDACIEGEVCTSGVCGGGTATDCTGVGGQCATAACNPGGSEGNCDDLTPLGDGTGCDDGSACTSDETCQAGVCTPAVTVNCAVNNTACRLFDCDPNGAQDNCSLIDNTTNQGQPCNDGGACVEDEMCDNGDCVGSAVDCSNVGDDCMTAECDPAGAEGNCSDVQNEPDGIECGVDDPCLEESGECLNGLCDADPKDTDGDGTPDCLDNCPLDFNKTDPGNCGCGKPDVDTDGDGIHDCLCPFQETCSSDDDCAGDAVCFFYPQAPGDPQALGACSCQDDGGCASGGCLPTVPDGPSVCVTSFCGDLCPTDTAKDAPGVCGCNVADDDDDGDGVFDCACLHTPRPCVDDGDCGLNGMCATCGVGGDCGGFDQVCIIGDGCGDWCPEDPDKVVPGLCGCGFSDDPDGDGDGVVDCLDACPDDPEKSESAGPCGCGEPDQSYTVGGIVHIPGSLLAGVPNVTVQLFCDALAYNESVTTCDAGYVGSFSFDNVPCGPCHLKFSYNEPCDDHFDVLVCGGSSAVGAGENVDIAVNAANGAGHSPCLQAIGATAYSGEYDILGFNEACREFAIGDPARPECMAERNGLPLTQALPPLAECFFGGQETATCCPAYADFGGVYDVDCFCRLDCNNDGIFSIVSDLQCWAQCLVNGACQPGGCSGPAPERANQGLAGHVIGGIVFSDEARPLISGVPGERVVVVDQDGYRYVVQTDALGVWAVDGLGAGPAWVYHVSSRSGFRVDVGAARRSKNQSLRHLVPAPRRRPDNAGVGR